MHVHVAASRIGLKTQFRREIIMSANVAVGGLSVGGALYTGAAALLEGVALKAAKHLEHHKSLVSKIAQVALGLIALSAALAVTGGVSVAATAVVNFFVSSKLSATVISGIGLALSAAATLPFHWKAFKWSHLV